MTEFFFTSVKYLHDQSFSHQSQSSSFGYLLHSMSCVQLQLSRLQWHRRHPTSSHLTSGCLWPVDENAVGKNEFATPTKLDSGTFKGSE